MVARGGSVAAAPILAQEGKRAPLSIQFNCERLVSAETEQDCYSGRKGENEEANYLANYSSGVNDFPFRNDPEGMGRRINCPGCN